MRQRRLKAYWQTPRRTLPSAPAPRCGAQKLGAAQEKAGRGAASLVTVNVDAAGALT